MMKASLALGAMAVALFILSFVPLPAATTAQDAPGAPESDPETAVAQGRTLFMAKGCTACHRHADVGRQEWVTEMGPDLTSYEVDETFVRAWLRDPQALRPDTFMPNLALGDEEIEALIAFLGASSAPTP